MKTNELGGIDINQSRLTDLLNCEELYYLRYEFDDKGLVPKGRELALVIGSAYHDGIAEYYHKSRDVNSALAKSLETFDKNRAEVKLLSEERLEWDEARMLVEVMVTRYHHRWKGEAIELLATEVVGAVRLGSSRHRLLFRTDVVCQELGSIKLLDHKTKGRTPSAFEIAKIHSDLQPTAYIYGVSKQTGMKVEGLKIRYQIKRADYPPEKAMFEEYTARTPRDLSRFEEEAIELCDRILRRRQDGKWLHNWSHCLTYGECRMRRICLHHRDSAVISMYDHRSADYVDESQEGS